MAFFKKPQNVTELQIPPAAIASGKAVELARVWAANDQQHVTLGAEMWDDPFAWGIMLVDLANHVANAYEQTKGFDRAKTLARIKAGFDAEWGNPTDKATGAVQK
jgi:hypothetical protein